MSIIALNHALNEALTHCTRTVFEKKMQLPMPITPKGSIYICPRKGTSQFVARPAVEKRGRKFG